MKKRGNRLKEFGENKLEDKKKESIIIDYGKQQETCTRNLLFSA